MPVFLSHCRGKAASGRGDGVSPADLTFACPRPADQEAGMGDGDIVMALHARNANLCLNSRQAVHWLGLSARRRGRGEGPLFRRHSRCKCYQVDDLITGAEYRRSVPADA
jgi:hypothetical protein